MRFERPDVEKREQVWQSVVSEQGAGAIISEEELKRFASEFQITAGGIAQAIAGTKKLLDDRLRVALFCNRIWDCSPDYESYGKTIRRHTKPYFGLEMNVKI